MDISEQYRKIRDEYGDAAPLWSEFEDQKKREEEEENKALAADRKYWAERRNITRKQRVSSRKLSKSFFNN